MNLVQFSRFAKIAAIGTSTCLLLVFHPEAAFAHASTTPTSVRVGSTATVGFLIKHGCGQQPTIKVALRMPSGVTNIRAVPTGAWTASVTGQVVTFTGGNLPSPAKGTFSVRATFPATVGIIAVPLIQTCPKGENAWLQVPVSGQPVPEYPIPQLRIVR